MEELDPMERMRRRYQLDKGGGPPPRRIPTLDEELASHLKVTNIAPDFEYKPVPRTEDDE